jgi:hypothetical protein
MKRIKESTIKTVNLYLDLIDSCQYIVENGKLVNKKRRSIGYVGKNGYVQLSINSKKVYLHQVLFAYYFGVNELVKYESVNHIDGNKLNNLMNNLEGMSLSENSQHQHQIGLTPVGGECAQSILNEESVKKIRKLLKQGFKQHKIAEHFNVSRSAINSINNNISWTSVMSDDDIEIPYIDNRKNKRSDAVLTNVQVKEIKKLLKLGYYQKVIARQYRISRSLVLQINLNNRYYEVNYDDSVDISNIISQMKG